MHFAPEFGLGEKIKSIVGDNYYHAYDIDPRLYPKTANVQRFDLTTDIEAIESESVDLIIHCHVLEHIPCTMAHTLFHMHRILKTDGLHACVIPISPGRWDESFDPALSDSDRQKRFGQHDHVRRIGKLDIQSTLGKIIDIEPYLTFDATRDFPQETLKRFNIPESHWYGLTFGTPLLLSKAAYRLR